MPQDPQRAAQPTQRLTRAPLLLVWTMLIAVVIAAFSSAGAAQPSTQFSHPGFKALWDRTDGLVASGGVKRPWVWGPVPGRTAQEPFLGLPGGAHLVQYFDKGRMELNNPNADPNSPFYVTNGLLSVELISGQMQVGTAQYEQRGPAVIPLASDPDDASAPTYQSFNGISSIPGAPNNRRAPQQTGQTVRTAIDRQGVTQPWPSDHPDYGVRLAHYETVTGHNVPDVFWEYLNQQTEIIQGGQRVRGPLFYPWFAVSGYPISEPYWAYVKVAGRYTDVLIQAFERRVLTFVPHLPSPYKVQMGNIGQHYVEWRYNPVAQPTPPRAATPTTIALPAKAAITIDSISHRVLITDINGTFATLTNRGTTPQTLNGWQLHSPKWSHTDRFSFPDNVTIQPGASLRVHSGPGANTNADVYMFRTNVMWDRQPYDLAVLYDNFGREVARLFPASGGALPTLPPVGTPTALTGTPRPGTPQPSPSKGDTTAVPTTVSGTPGTATVTATRTTGVPSPVGTGVVLTPTRTTAAATATRTSTPGSGGCPVVEESRKSRIEDDGTLIIFDVQYTEDENVNVFFISEDDMNVSGWTVRDKNMPSRRYTFPQGSLLTFGDDIYIYTAPGHPYSFNSTTPIWDDCGAAIELRDAGGAIRSTFAYGNHLIP